MTKRSKRFEMRLAFGRGRGIYRLEVTAVASGNRTHSAARVRFFAGVPADFEEPPLPADDPPDEVVNVDMLQARCFAAMNAHRMGARLKHLPWLEPLARACVQHARDCVAEGKIDHRVNRKGNVADRFKSAYGLERVAYARPPRSHRQTNEPTAQTYMSVAVGSASSMEHLIGKWGRQAAFCLPMTSELMTHAACGVARKRDGRWYVVFAFAQINGVAVPKAMDVVFGADRQAYKDARGDERPPALRRLGAWRRKRSTSELKKRTRDRDLALRVAAWDGLLLVDELRTRADLRKLYGTTDAAKFGPRALGLMRESLIQEGQIKSEIELP